MKLQQGGATLEPGGEEGQRQIDEKERREGSGEREEGGVGGEGEWQV